MPQSFDEAFPGGFEECVSTLGQEPSIDDAEALCGWLQENGFESIADADPDSVLASLEVEFVSVVDQPAQDSEWLMAKSEDADSSDFQPGGDDRIREAGVLFKDSPADADDPAKKVWAAVLKPGESDAHGDLVPEPEIEKAAHTYLKEFRKVDSDHDLLDGEGEPIESYIVRNGPDEFTTPDGSTKTYPEGTWIMGVELSDEAWKRVEDGELTGFSIYGGAAKLNPNALLTEEQAKAIMDARENTEKQVPDAFLDAFDAYVDDTGGSPSEVTLSDFLSWALDDGEAVEVGGETVEGGDGTETTGEDEDGDSEASSGDDEDENDEEEVEEQARKTLAVAKSMGDENDDDGDVSEILTEIRDTVKSTNEQVEAHDDRLDEIRDDLDETRKEVGLVEGEESETEEESEASDEDGEESEETEKNSDYVTEERFEEFEETVLDAVGKSEESGEESEEEEVVRKGDRTPTDEEEVEKNQNGTASVDLSTDGITDAGQVN